MNPIRKALVAGALAVPAIAGGAVGIGILAGGASAQTATTTDDGTTTTAPPAVTPAPAPSTDSTDAPKAQRDPSKGGHMANGITETVLTGDTATKVTDAAKAAVPDGTIERVETDAEGATYEAHVVKADGSHVTVKLDANFAVTTVETGGGR
jgi:hypothetical protein